MSYVGTKGGRLNSGGFWEQKRLQNKNLTLSFHNGSITGRVKVRIRCAHLLKARIWLDETHIQHETAARLNSQMDAQSACCPKTGSLTWISEFLTGSKILSTGIHMHVISICGIQNINKIFVKIYK